VATWGAAILFPGFLIYHTLIAAFALPPIFGGFFATVSIAFAVLTVSAAIPAARASAAEVNWASLAAVFFLAYAFLWALGWRSMSSAVYIDEAFTQSIASLGLIAALFVIGRFIDLDNKTSRGLFPVFATIIFTLLLLNFAATGNARFDARLQFSAGEEVASYQGFATSTMLIGVLAAAVSRTQSIRYAVIGMTIVSLFMMSSRSEFVAFVLGALAFAAAATIKSPRAAFFVIALGLGLLGFIANNDYILANSRFSELASLESSSSYIYRNYFDQIAWEQILQNPIIGYFGGHFLVQDSGSYAHSILSSWVSFGLVGFLIYGFLNLTPAMRAAFEIFYRGNSHPIWWAVLFLGSIVTVLTLFAKPVFWEVPGLLWGMFAQAVTYQSSGQVATTPAQSGDAQFSEANVAVLPNAGVH
jgi:hypothetical protein